MTYSGAIAQFTLSKIKEKNCHLNAHLMYLTPAHCSLDKPIVNVLRILHWPTAGKTHLK